MALFQETLLSGPQTASTFSGEWVKIPTLDMAAISAYVTAASGITAIDLFIQISPDKSEARAVDVPFDQVLKTADSGTAGTVNTNVRDLIDNKTTTSAESFYGLIKHLPAGFIRARGKLNGTSVTVEVNLQGK